ncbi:UDP-N-acetylmuramate--alanine ligase [Bifidobacterium italicum]|uniref:UDP-N-acetylmuramate--L-alanine ligase n=1 Tax=Bifidobacterium italicum TaxID=1960968 RepID=A0A2A2EK29_9BIFI|nr:UDP-N-acetylmuramate--alanine ligase [Bifidobacterium italicum]
MNEQTPQPIDLDPTIARFASAERTADLGRTHFIGIGGAGMSVLAEMLHQQGVDVDGSDMQPGAKTERLVSLGIPVSIGQHEGNVRDAQVVVYSSAIKADNPEIVAAAAQGSRIVHRSDILALLMHGRRAVTVAGAHGKTTTSSMLAHILTHGGTGALSDPSYAIGGSIQGPDGAMIDGGHAGAGDVLVAEADESDGSFAKYAPQIAIVTNAEPDHLDHYGDAEAYRAAFVDHLGHARGAIVVCADDASALAVLRQLDAATAAHAIAYGTTSREDVGELNGARYVHIAAETEHAGDGAESFTLDMPASVAEGRMDASGDDEGVVHVPVTLAVPGLHNARNATAAIVAATLLGMDPHQAAEAVPTFLGAARRFQIRAQVNGVTVVDDYAHHPTEIAALLDAARRRYPDATIHVLFQPHLFSRTKFFAKEFADALGSADDVIVTGVFPARERQQDFPDVGAATIADMAGADAPIDVEERMETAAQMIAMRAKPGDVVFTVGAGDITKMVPVIAHVLEAHAGKDD